MRGAFCDAGNDLDEPQAYRCEPAIANEVVLEIAVLAQPLKVHRQR